MFSHEPPHRRVLSERETEGNPLEAVGFPACVSTFIRAPVSKAVLDAGEVIAIVLHPYLDQTH